MDLCQSPKGLQVQNAVKGVKHFTGRTDQLHHGPSPLELAEEFVPGRRMTHGKAIQGDTSQLHQSRQGSPRLEAAHRRSTAVWSCFDKVPACQALPRPSLRHNQSCGAARGMQVKAGKPETLEENPSGEETSDGFPVPRRSRERRHQSHKPSGTLADGLSTKELQEWREVALGGKQRGRKNRGAEEYCRGGPGPWDPLPEGVAKKDGWGRFSPREPPLRSPLALRAPFGTNENTEHFGVKRFSSAPPVLRLPYGSDVDVARLSDPPQTGFPLGLEAEMAPSQLALSHFDGVSGCRSANLQEESVEIASARGPRSHGWTDGPSQLNKPAAPMRSLSADRRGKSLMSSDFVQRQRATNRLRGGSARLPSGGNLSHTLLRPDRFDRARTQKSDTGPRIARALVPPNPHLEQAYQKCLESLRSEIEQLQMRSSRLEEEVHKTASENETVGMLKGRPKTEG